MERRLEELERQTAPRRVPGMTDDGLSEQLAGLDPQTRAALDTLSHEDFRRWVGGMVWYATQPT
jgi:hypothetical protein